MLAADSSFLPPRLPVPGEDQQDAHSAFEGPLPRGRGRLHQRGMQPREGRKDGGELIQMQESWIECSCSTKTLTRILTTPFKTGNDGSHKIPLLFAFGTGRRDAHLLLDHIQYRVCNRGLSKCLLNDALEIQAHAHS
jgi:hypothetical protein